MSKIALSGNASGTGTLTLSAPNTNSDRTLTLPDAAGTVFVSGQALSAATGSFSGDVTLGSSVLATPSGSAPSYTCRAWVNFNGTGTVAIRASGNVSSITDNGTGNYTVNFATAMPDANYGCHFGFPSFATNDIALNVAVRGTIAGGPNNKTTSAVSILSGRAYATTLDDLVDIYVAIFR